MKTSSESKTGDNLRIGTGKPGPGRPKGAPNKTTQALKDAILVAAERVGRDGKGNGQLVGYLERVANEDVKAFCGLLGRVLPLQLAGDADNPLTVTVQRLTDTAK